MGFKFKWFFTFLVAFTMQFALAQQKTVTGKVTSGGVVLPGAAVSILGTNLGAQTDENGKFSIKASQGDVLEFSFLGKETMLVTVGASNVVNVALVGKVETLETVLVTGAFGIKRKANALTTSTQVVKGEELTKAGNPNAVQALAGRVSGLQINTTSTGLDPNVSIVFRGAKSISRSNSALIVIDNVISSSSILQSLDPNIIESVNSLKGANAAALYGEQGVNGALIVTTKKGSNKKGKLKVDFNSSTSFEQIAFLPNTQNKYGQGWQGDLDWTDQGSWGPEYDGSQQVVGIPYPGLTDWRLSTYEDIEDNIKPFFNTGVTKQNTLSINGGNLDQGYFGLSLSRLDIDGVIPDDVRSKNFINVSAGKKLNKFTFSGITRYTYDKTNRTFANTYQNLSNTAGNIRVEDFNSGDNGDHWTLYDDSPYWQLKNERNISSSDVFEINGEIKYEFNKNINFNLRSTKRLSSTDGYAYSNGYRDLLQLTGTNRTIRSSYTTSIANSDTWYNDLMANFNYDLTSNINLTANLGMNLQDANSTSINAGGNDLALANFYDLSNVSNLVTTTQLKGKARSAGAFVNVDLAYKNFLYLNLTGRNDWVSVMPKNNNSFFYPSAGLSFVGTNAFPSIKGKVLNYAKVSASVVKVGTTAALGQFQVNEVAPQGAGFPYFLTSSNSFILETSYVDPNIKPEFVTSNEFNLNLDFFNSRLTLDAAASFATNKDQMLNITTSSATGYGSTLINIGETETKAYEIDLGFTPIRTDNFTWKNTIGYSTYKTVVNKVTDQSDRVGAGSPGLYAIEGQEFPMLMGTGYTRDEEGRVVLDASGAPVRDGGLKMLGQTTPDYIINFQTEFRYKNLKLSAVADFRTGHKFYSGVKDQLNSQGRTFESAQNDREPFLFPNSTIQGSGITNTSVLTGGSGSYAGYQSYVVDNYGFFDENFVLDATALKVREIALSYELSKKVTDYLKLSRISLGLSGRNLFMFLPKENRGYNDPETGSGLAGYSFTPPTKFYTFNININF
jgi:TonB-linked SusC/RagA family outer membrane protein